MMANLGYAFSLLIYPLNWLLSVFASVIRLGAGAGTIAQKDSGSYILYDFEGCPFCRVARESISELGLVVLVKPCPKGGRRFRPDVYELGGKSQFPYLQDPSNGEALYESADIGKYLRSERQGVSRPFIHWLGPINHVSSQVCTLLRFMGGMRVRKSVAPVKPLEFYGAERGPAARIVRELLCEMELQYFSRPKERGDSPSVMLVDPNTNTVVTGPLTIRKYLKTTYAA